MSLYIFWAEESLCFTVIDADMKLVQVNDLSHFQELMRSNPPRTMYFVHSTRDDIIMAFLQENERRRHCNQVFEAALMICGPNVNDISKEVRDKIRHGLYVPPIVVVPYLTREAISMIHDYTPKLNADDSNRVTKAVEHYEPYVDFEQLLARTKLAYSVKTQNGVGQVVSEPMKEFQHSADSNFLAQI